MRFTRTGISENQIVESCSLFANWIEEESRGELANMLPQDAGVLAQQARSGLSVIAINKIAFLGHATMWEYNCASVAEVGALIVHPHYRGEGYGKKVIAKVVEEFQTRYGLIIATVKTPAAEKAFRDNGFIEDSFQSLPEDILNECCVCYSPSKKCPKKKNKTCRLLIYRGK